MAKYFTLLVNVIFLFLIFFVIIHFNSIHIKNPNSLISSYKLFDEEIGCKGIQKYHKKQAKCSYIKSHKGCQSNGYISYLRLFYCTFSPNLGYFLLAIWLLVLFYLLGDTSQTYFCESLEGLSRNLKLSPVIAGVTLLSLGNGAPDVFGSIISFMGDGSTSDIGLNSILGGSFFISTVVVGIISILLSNHHRIISSSSFICNFLFLIFSLFCLLVIIIIGKINFWGALFFFSLYFIYAAVIFSLEAYSRRGRIAEELEVPILDFEDQITKERGRRIRGAHMEFLKKFLWVLEIPLDLPRKLTIPIFSEKKWSKPVGIISTALAPVLMASIWNLNYPKSNQLVYGIGGLVGFFSSILLFFISDSFNPPRKCKFPWLLESFLMSITWTYILAQELISLMASLGIILGISHSVMGLLILAWGNSLGDLFSNVTMAQNGGQGGAQVAISGCYSGPVFNILVGLGLSLAMSSWALYPSSLTITSDSSLYETFGFFLVAMVWGFLILRIRKMRLDKVLGIGLLTIYSCFLVFKLARTFGLVQFQFSLSYFKLKY